MTIAFSEYLPEILPDVPGCPRQTAINAIRRASRRLCNDALVWRQTLSAINVVEGDDDYTLSAPSADTEIITGVYVEYDGVPIDPKSPAELDAIDYNWRNAGKATPFAWFMEDDTTLKLNRQPAEDITGGLVVRVALRPSDTATGANDSLYNTYREAVIHGALHYLMQIPKKEWTNAELALFHGRHFNHHLTRAKSWVDRGRTRQPTRARMQFFA